MNRGLFSAVLFLSVLSFGLVSPSSSASGVCSSSAPALETTITCTTAGAMDITIPVGAGAVTITAIGGGGASGVDASFGHPAFSFRGGHGGVGAKIVGKLLLPVGSTVANVTVGGGGTNSGGGYSSLTAGVGTPNTLLAVAGAGGQGGEGRLSAVGGAGGAGAATNTAAGGDGQSVDDDSSGAGGRGGSSGTGGAGGSYPSLAAGTSGATWAAGGAGGTSRSGGGGGNGGAGYGGGGGAGQSGLNNAASGGGGAGGSYANPTYVSGTATFSPSDETYGAGGIGISGGTSNPGASGYVALTFHAAPVVTAVSPGTGPVLGSNSITIEGSNLTGATSVLVGSAAATITTNTAERITALVPTGFGTQGVTVSTPNGSGTLAASYTYDSPTITSIAPSSGSALGGLRVQINGTNLTYVTGVTFGGVAATDLDVTDTRVTVTIPSTSSAGAVDVVVSAQGPATATSASGFTYLAVVPAAPTSVAATAGIESATVSWTPGLNGGSAILDYTVTWTSGSQTCSASSSSCVITGLTGNTNYTFTVKARNSIGSSSSSVASNQITAQPKTVPGSPTGVGGVAGIEKVTVSWSAPVSNGGSAITDYIVSANPGVRTCATTGDLSCEVTGLTAGTSYTFTVIAKNAIGDSVPSSASTSITPLSPVVPDAPRNATAVAGILGATISWDAPLSDGGRTITEYTVTASPGGASCASASTSCSITGLSYLESYTFTVVAKNTVGDSLPSVATSPAVVPLTPTISGVSPSSGSANGGTTVVISGTNLSGATEVLFGTTAATIVSSTSTSVTVTTPAIAVAGSVNISVTVPGPASVAAGSAYMYTAVPPDVITGLTATAGIESAELTWTAPAQFGGGSFTRYYVVSTPDAQVCFTYSTMATSCTISGLRDGVTYVFTARAQTSAGYGPESNYSNSIVALAPTVPGAPTSVTATPGVNRATVSWTAPTNNGGRSISSYTVTSSGTPAQTCSTATTSCTVGNLDPMTAYTFTVKATNSVGMSTASAPSASVTTLVPSITSLSPTFGPSSGSTTVTITGTDLSNATSVSFGGFLGTVVSSTSTQVVAVTPAMGALGLVDVVVGVEGDASAILGSGFQSNASAPSPPTSVNASITGINSAVISWTPGFDGGFAISQYSVTVIPSGAGCTTTGATTCTVSDLLPSTNYTFTVTATNQIGPSVASAASNSVTALFPSITSLTPASGSTAGGTLVDVVGTNLGNTIDITFNGVSGTIQALSATTVRATTPASSSTGVVDVVISVTGGYSAIAGSSFTYTSPGGGGGSSGGGGGSSGGGGAGGGDVASPSTPTSGGAQVSPSVAVNEVSKSALISALSKLARGDIAGLTLDELRQLPPSAFRFLSRATMSLFSAAQMRVLSREQLRAISPFALKGVRAEALKGMSVKQLAGLTARQKSALTTKQRDALTEKQRTAIEPKTRG